MAQRSKRYLNLEAMADGQQPREPGAAIALAKQMASAKFDETMEVHLRTGADPRHADQQIRGVAMLPNGLGKSVRVLVFAQGEAAEAAREAGAEYVGDDDLVERIEGGWVEFDTSIATPDMMGKVGRLGRVLGRRGLMPNPRTGTVVAPGDIGRAVTEAKQGRVEVRMDRTAIILAPVGKASFENGALLENLAALMEMIVRARPASVKGQFVRSGYLTTSMGPSVRLDLPSLLALRVE